MPRILTTLLLFGFCLTANADVWKWVDANGKTHFVDTMTPIYTWIDEFGKAHYSDTPDHEDAVSVELVWHAPGTLADVGDSADNSETGGSAYPGETGAEQADHADKKAHYCERAKEVYESYINAPQLYRTDENGERVFLSKEETAATIAETKARRDKYCN